MTHMTNTAAAVLAIAVASTAGVRQGAAKPDQASPQRLTPAAAARVLEEHLGEQARLGRFSGAVLVAKDGDPFFRRAYGLADRERGVANTPETKFNLGSIDKIMTAVAIAQLVQRGALAYEDPVAKFIPDFPSPEEARKVQIRHLLTHTSGLGMFFTERFLRERPRTVPGILDVARENAALQFEPGTKQRYSNTGFLLLGAIVEKVSGRTYWDHMREHVYGPAGMRSTMPLDEAERTGGMARSYAPAAPGSPERREATPWPSSPAGGGYSTVDDLLRFAEAFRSGRLVSAATLAEMVKPRPEIGAPRGGYGVGRWRESPLIVGYNGGAPGIHAHLDIFMESGYTTVLLSNEADGTPVHEDVVRHIRELVARIDSPARR